MEEIQRIVALPQQNNFILQSEIFLAKLISYIFHPALLPLAGVLIFFHLDGTELWHPSFEMQLIIYASVFVSTFLLPLLNALYLFKAGYISSLKMESRQERRIPYLCTTIFYLAGFSFLMRLDVWVLIKMLMLGATILAFILLIINFFWKISAHTVGIGGLCGLMIVVSFRLQINILPLLIVLFIIAGLVAFSRLKLNAHSPAQVYAGFLLGITLPLILFYT